MPQTKCSSASERDNALFMEELQVLLLGSPAVSEHHLEEFDEDKRYIYGLYYVHALLIIHTIYSMFKT